MVGSSVEAHVKALEARIIEVTRQRDELQADVESLCMQGTTGSIFDSSSVLTEKIFAVERELRHTRQQLESVVAERDNLREDARGFRESKRIVDRGWQEEKVKNEKLEKELAFYQGQGARAMADRDRAAVEAEELRAQTLSLGRQLKEVEAKFDSELTQRLDRERKLRSARAQISELMEEVKGLDVIPGLRSDLGNARARIEALQEEAAQLQSDLDASRQQYGGATAALAELTIDRDGLAKQLCEAHAEAAAAAEKYEAEIQGLKADVARLEERAESAEGYVEETRQALTAARARCEELQAAADAAIDGLTRKHAEEVASSTSRHTAEVEALQEELGQVKEARQQAVASLEQATGEKVATLMRLSDSQQQASRAERDAESLRKQLASAKAQLQEAAAGKAAALKEVSVLRERSGELPRAGSHPSPVKPAKSAPINGKAFGWRMWGSSQAASEDGQLEAGDLHSTVSDDPDPAPAAPPQDGSNQ